MRYKRQWLCTAAIMIILCGCSQKTDSVEMSLNDSRAAEQKEAEAEAEDIFDITVIDTLPAVDENVPRELTKPSSSEIINIMDSREAKLYIQQEDGAFLEEQFSIYNVICHDHDVSFAMPKDGQIIWRDSGVSVQYIGEREYEILSELNEKNVVGNDCREFNEGMARTRELIAEGFLQDEFEKYLSDFPELKLENKELTLELTYAGRTDRTEDGTSWWELDYSLYTSLEDGSKLTLAAMDISKLILVQGEEDTWDDAHYRIWGYPASMWELLEQPQEDKGETLLTVLPEKTFTDEDSIYDYMEQYAKERRITWEFEGEDSFWYNYLLWKGEGGGYQYQMAVPIMNEEAGSWLIQAKIKKGADRPEECWYAFSVFMQTFHANPYFFDVKEGDTLYEIAATYLGDGDDYIRLAAINGLANPDIIYEGQLLKIPVEK